MMRISLYRGVVGDGSVAMASLSQTSLGPRHRVITDHCTCACRLSCMMTSTSWLEDSLPPDIRETIKAASVSSPSSDASRVVCHTCETPIRRLN